MLIEYGEGLKKADINLEDAWANEGKIVLIDAPNQQKVLSRIVEPYDPDEEEDEDVDHCEVFWCERVDKQPWGSHYKDGIKNGTKWLAVHHAYMFMPFKGDWDTEENENE